MDAILLSTMALYYRKLKNARKYLQSVHRLRVFSAFFIYWIPETVSILTIFSFLLRQHDSKC